MLDALPPQHSAELLGFFNGNSAHQHRLTLFVALHNFPNHRPVFALLRFIDHVGQILADQGLVGGDFNHVQSVNLAEFVLFGEGGARHT